MRTFIAIELPQEIKDFLAQLQAELKSTNADVKWVAPENIHLTLKFLGEIDDKQLEKVVQIINEAGKEKDKFQVSISSLGAFPKIDFPRVIWIGIESKDKQVKEIAKDLEEKIARIGIPREKRAFSSHITIGRVRSPLNRQELVLDLKNKADLSGQNLHFYVTKITLFKSTLTPKGPIYEILKETSLKAT